MTQYLFSKKQLLRLIKESPSSDDMVAMTVGFECMESGNKKCIVAKVTAHTAKHHGRGKIKISSRQEAPEGCPYPPGCITG